MERIVQLAAFAFGDFLLVPDNDSLFKVVIGVLILVYGLIAICAVLKDDLKRARTSLFAALGLILLIETFSPLDWGALAKWPSESLPRFHYSHSTSKP